MFNVALAWWNQRKYDGSVWDMPRGASRLLIFFIGTIFISFLRLIISPTQYAPYDFAGLVNEAFVNSLKFMLPFYLFYDGCRTPERTKAALASIVSMYFILGVLVIKSMGLSSAGAGQDLNGRGAKLIHAGTGYHRVDMAMMLAGAAWALLAFMGVVKEKKYKLLFLGGFGIVSVAEGMTGGRTGYVTWVIIGLFLCVLRWRKLLLLFPIGLTVALSFMPAVTQRMTTGFGSTEGNIIVHSDADQITSDRTQVWPYALHGIFQSPIWGYGRFGFMRSGTAAKYAAETSADAVDHPHCAYLEMLLDNGIIGFMLVIPLYVILVFYSLKLFLDRSDALNSAVGATCLVLFLSLLIAAVGAQTLYPKEDVAGMWAAAGLVLRRYVDRNRVQEVEHEEAEEMAGAYAANA
jgi:O-antigen ligase